MTFVDKIARILRGRKAQRSCDNHKEALTYEEALRERNEYMRGIDIRLGMATKNHRKVAPIYARAKAYTHRALDRGRNG